MNEKIKTILIQMNYPLDKTDYTLIDIELIDNKICTNYINNDIFANSTEYFINKYEFQHMCKELMKERHICVWSGNGFNKSIGYECSITHFMCGDKITYKSDTEFEAVIDATYSVITGAIEF